MYPVIAQIKTPEGPFPLVDIPTMDDDRWQQLARKNAVANYTRVNREAPESVELALEWQRGFLVKNYQRSYEVIAKKDRQT